MKLSEALDAVAKSSDRNFPFTAGLIRVAADAAREMEDEVAFLGTIQAIVLDHTRRLAALEKAKEPEIEIWKGCPGEVCYDLHSHYQHQANPKPSTGEAATTSSRCRGGRMPDDPKPAPYLADVARLTADLAQAEAMFDNESDEHAKCERSLKAKLAQAERDADKAEIEARLFKTRAEQSEAAYEEHIRATDCLTYKRRAEQAEARVKELEERLAKHENL